MSASDVDLAVNPAVNPLIQANVLREPVMLDIIRASHLPQGSKGLDAGCGAGLQTLLLAEAVGPRGHVTGLDASAANLKLAEKISRQANLEGRIAFRLGDWNELPFEDGVFDWAWSADGVGYAAEEPVRLIGELRRVVKPGGSLVISFWSSQSLLPGYPALEARLNATSAGIAPFSAQALPETHYLRALGWLGELGLVEVRAGTFVRSVFAPLENEVQAALSALLEMRWSGAEAEISAKDWSDYQRLCQPDSADWILKRPDYYAFFTYSAFWGKVL